MITTTLSFAMNLILYSYQGVRAVSRVLGYALPYSSMAGNKHNIDFNTKHLKKGDPLPPFTGKLRVYNMRFCPFAQRTILALNAKGLDYEVINIDLMDKPEWITNKSAFGKVPAIEVKEGETVYESVVTVEYLDEIFPEKPLLPKDPLKKAFDKIILESISPIHTLYYKGVRPNAASPISEDNIAAYNKALDFIQSQLISRGTKFLDGDEPGFIDYMIWPWFERLPAFEKDERFKIDPVKFGKLHKYLDNMREDPAVSQYLVPKEIFQKFHEAYWSGAKPDYDKFTAALSQ